MKKLLILAAGMLLIFNNSVKATHAVGADLSYQCLGGNKYKVTFTFYRDCGGNAGAIPTASDNTVNLRIKTNCVTPTCSTIITPRLDTVFNLSNPGCTVTPNITPCVPQIPAFDAKSGKTIGSGNPPSDSTTISWNHTTSSGLNRLLVVQVASMTVYATGVTYAGSPLTLLQSSVNGDYRAQVWYMVNPPTGINMVKVTFPAGTGTFYPEKSAEAITFTGVNQTTPFGTAVAATGTACPSSITVNTAVNDLVLDMIVKDYFYAVSPLAGQGGLYSITYFPSNAVGGSTKTGAAGTTTTQWQWNFCSAEQWAAISVPIKAKACASAYDTTYSYTPQCYSVDTIGWDTTYQSCPPNPTSVTLTKIAGTGNEVTPLCPSATSTCSGGPNPGIRQFVFEGEVTLPAGCSDIVFSMSVWARNNSITTVATPGSDSLYVEAHLNNTLPTCNSSPSFTNIPVPFICIGQTYCFNHGATDIDGDSLVFNLITPKAGPALDVVYLAGYSSLQPVKSTPPVSINPITGDICMKPTQADVSIVAVRVDEYRNGIKIGSTIRDMQINIINCTNNLPYLNGINNSGSFDTLVCAGNQICIDIPVYDADGGNTVTIDWNQGIPGATWTTTGGTRPTGTFCWTPTVVGSTLPFIFTVTVQDDACPYFGSQTYAFSIYLQTCIPTVITTGTPVCPGGCSNLLANVNSGAPPYTYNWSPNIGSGAGPHSVCPGSTSTYTVTITDKLGTTSTDTAVVGFNPVSSLNTNKTDILCNGNNNGTATVTPTGGNSPYTYLWSTGGTSSTINNLSPGTYTVTTTTTNGCTSTATAVVAEPQPLNAPVNDINVNCNGGNNGTATVIPSGGVQPYTYAWSPSGGNGATAVSLTSGIYTVTVTDINGCSITSTTNITQPSSLNSSMNQTGVSCNGNTNGSGTVTPSGGTSPYTYAWSPAGGTGSTANNLSGGTYTVTITDNNGCSLTNSVTVAEPAPLANTTSQTNVPCSGGNNGTATATPNGGTAPYTYNWSSGGNTSSIANLTSGNYTVTVTDLQGCSTTSVVNITSAGSLVTTYTQSNVLCSGGNTGSIDATITGGTAPYTYTWSNGSGVQDLSGLTAGTYTLTVTDINGCQAIVNSTITQPQVLSEIINTTDVACYAGSDGTINLTPSGGTVPYTFSWSDGPVTEDRSGLTAGTYTVTITDLQGCSRTASAPIAEPIEPLQLNNSSSNVSCSGSNDGSATVVPIGGTSPYTYQWLPAGGSGSVAVGLSGGTYTAVITDIKGCTKTATVVVNESPLLLSPNINGNIPVSCTGSGDGSLTVTPTGGSVPYTYAWSPTGGTGPSANNLSGGIYTVTITDTYGCSKTATDEVKEAPQLLTPLISANTPVSCAGSGNGSLTVNTTGGTQPFTYQWSPSGGTGPSANNLSGGIYTVTVTDQYGCSKTVTDQVQESPLILGLNLNNAVPVTCAGNSNGSVTTTPSGGTQPYTYQWSAGASTGPSANNLPGGIYTVTVTDLFGCSRTVTAEVKEAAQLLGLNAGNIKNVTCAGSNDGSVTVVPAGGMQPYTYQWSPSGGTGPSANNLSGGTYTVTVTDLFGCSQTRTAVVLESLTPLTGNFNSTDVTCFGDGNGSATVTPVGGTGPYTYSWSPNSGNTPVAGGLSGGTYTVIVTDALGCSKTYTGMVTEPNKVTAGVTPNPPSGLAPLYVDFTNNSSGASGYIWVFGDGTQDTVFNPTHVFTAPGEYTVMLIAYNSFGCPDTVYVKIKVVEKSRITVPNIFTPNKDGVNDLFNPIINGLASIKGVIYNRWGELIYKWDSPRGGWDGRTNSGLEVPDGVYYYVVDAEGSDGEIYKSTGFITLVRQ